MDWKINRLKLFFSERKQNRIKSILEGMRANRQPEERVYDGLFEEVFPAKKEIPVLWNVMDVNQKCEFLKIAAQVIDAYQEIWHRYPRFLPMFLKNILKLM